MREEPSGSSRHGWGRLPVSSIIEGNQPAAGRPVVGRAGAIVTISDMIQVSGLAIKIPDRNHSVIFFTIRPSRKTVIPPPLWETTIPTPFVTLVMAATELCRVPIPGGRVTLLESTVI